MNIKHLKHEEIDYLLWDKTISEAENSFIYAFSWFLDCVTPGWEALVNENYEYIMPLPVKKKFGFKYIVQPTLTQQLGIFSSKPIAEDIIKEFIRFIPYLSYEMNLNERNYVPNSIAYPNLMLNLSVGYENLSKGISINTQRNIRKAENYYLKTEWNLSSTEFLQFYFDEEKNYHLPDSLITKKIVTSGLEHNQVQLIGVKSMEGKLIAALGLFSCCNRLIYLLPSSSTKGKEKAAMFYLVNEIIKKYAGTNKMLDFEGSRIEGVARFYEGFGAKPTSYFVIKRYRPHFLVGK